MENELINEFNILLKENNIEMIEAISALPNKGLIYLELKSSSVNLGEGNRLFAILDIQDANCPINFEYHYDGDIIKSLDEIKYIKGESLNIVIDSLEGARWMYLKELKKEGLL